MIYYIFISLARITSDPEEEMGTYIPPMGIYLTFLQPWGAWLKSRRVGHKGDVKENVARGSMMPLPIEDLTFTGRSPLSGLERGDAFMLIPGYSPLLSTTDPSPV
jgi:hypothetical protein